LKSSHRKSAPALCFQYWTILLVHPLLSAQHQSALNQLPPELENGFEKNLGFYLGFLKNLKTSKVQNVGFFIFWSNFIQIILIFIF